MELVLLPGVNNMASTFSVLRASLDDGVLAQALDLPARDRIEDVAKDVLSRAPEKFVALGHSFGGMVAMALAEIAPERLAGLILVNTCDWADTPALKDMRTDKAARALAGEYEDFANAATARAYHPDNAGRAELLVERANAVKAYGAERFAAHQRAMAARPNRRDVLIQSGLPILVVAADTDVVIPTEMQKDMAQQLGADFIEIRGGGHMLPVEQPEALAEAVVNWLPKVSTPSKGT